MEIELEINGQKARAREGETIMQVATRMGLYIPHFCYHPKLSIAANCRMCLVEVEKSPKPLPACATIALDGMVARLDSPKAKEAQNSVMEFLLINHPLDCPICDQGGECQLQDLAVGYGMSKSRYAEEKRVVFEKNLGPLISTDMTRCIHCTRCVRFGREIGGIMELGMTGRGEHAEIMPFIEQTVNSELSGNMIDVCPVGALTSKPFRFTARPWELSSAPGISPHDSWGSNLSLQVKGTEIKRVVPRSNDDINACWISDRDRFSYLGLTSKDRAMSPMFRHKDASQFTEFGWREVIAQCADELNKRAAIGQKIGFLTSPGATSEELFLWQKIARAIGCDNIDNRLRQRDCSIDAPVTFGFSISELAKATVLFIGADPAREQPLLGTHFRHGKRKRLLSVGAIDIGGHVPVAAQSVVRPSAIASEVAAINHEIKAKNKQNKTSAHIIAGLLEKARGTRHIIFGDSVIGADDFGDILHEAQTLAQNIGASLGTLSAGANGVGAKQFGVYPKNGGMSVNDIIDAKMDAVMLLNCEPDDFARAEDVRTMLSNTEFVCAITPFISGFQKIAHVVMPSAAFGENEGTFINGEGQEQTFSAVVAPPGHARPGWKILRVLGEAMGLDDFDFSGLNQVREMMKAIPPLASNDMNSTNGTGNSKSTSEKAEVNKFELTGGVPLYDTDMVVRRSGALQATSQGKNAARAFLHPEDMTALNITDGGAVRLSDGNGQKWDATAFADSRLARGAILAYPPNLRPTGIEVSVIGDA